MGANAQTTVQKFLSGAVLTAEQQNISAATGVPVFATTVTRDAAFGGANKVLAEGQLAYIEASNIVQYYDGAAWATVGPAAAAKVLQVVTGTNSTEAASSTTTYADTGLTATITPTLASSTILVFVNHTANIKTAGHVDNGLFLQLHRDGVSISQVADFMGWTNSLLSLYFSASLSFRDSPASVAALVYKTVFRNGAASAAVKVQADNLASSIILMEIAA